MMDVTMLMCRKVAPGYYTFFVGWLVLGLLFTDFVTSLLSSELSCPQFISVSLSSLCPYVLHKILVT